MCVREREGVGVGVGVGVGMGVGVYRAERVSRIMRWKLPLAWVIMVAAT